MGDHGKAEDLVPFLPLPSMYVLSGFGPGGELGDWRSRVSGTAMDVDHSGLRDGEGRNDARGRGFNLFPTLELSVILLPSEVQRICVAREVIYNTNPEMTASYTRLRLFQLSFSHRDNLLQLKTPRSLIDDKNLWLHGASDLPADQIP